MNIKRSILFGVLLWAIIFVVLSLLMFTPFLAGKVLLWHIVFWVLLVPIVLGLCKWYFKENPPTMKKGVLLGVAALVIGIVLDMALTMPLFILPQGGSYVAFYSDRMLYFGMAEVLILTTFAGVEFDATYSKPEKEKKS